MEKLFYPPPPSSSSILVISGPSKMVIEDRLFDRIGNDESRQKLCRPTKHFRQWKSFQRHSQGQTLTSHLFNQTLSIWNSRSILTKYTDTFLTEFHTESNAANYYVSNCTRLSGISLIGDCGIRNLRGYFGKHRSDFVSHHSPLFGHFGESNPQKLFFFLF